MGRPIRILLVEDNQVFREALELLLGMRADIEVVASVGDGSEAVAACDKYDPQVVLMDYRLPSMDGVQATRLVKQKSPGSQVIVLTSYHEDEHIFPAIRAGALSYLLKDIGLPDLADAIRKAAGGEVVMHPHIAARVVQELDGASHHDMANFAHLSEREREVLRLIAEGLSNAKIAERLVLSEKTVKSHVRNILGKLHLVDRTQAAIFAWRQGLMGS